MLLPKLAGHMCPKAQQSSHQVKCSWCQIELQLLQCGAACDSPSWSSYMSCQPEAGAAVAGVAGSANSGGGVFQGVLLAALTWPLVATGVTPSLCCSWCCGRPGILLSNHSLLQRARFGGQLLSETLELSQPAVM